MDKQSEVVEQIRFVKRADHRNSVLGEVYDERVRDLFYKCWPECYRGHAKWWSDLSVSTMPTYYRIRKGIRGVARKHFHLLNLVEVMYDEMGASFVRRLGPGFILGTTEYKPSPGTFASRRRKGRTNNRS